MTGLNNVTLPILVLRHIRLRILPFQIHAEHVDLFPQVPAAYCIQALRRLAEKENFRCVNQRIIISLLCMSPDSFLIVPDRASCIPKILASIIHSPPIIGWHYPKGRTIAVHPMQTWMEANVFFCGKMHVKAECWNRIPTFSRTCFASLYTS